MFYSDKKKRYTTVQNQIMINNHGGHILHKSNHKKGKRHGIHSHR
jgi:hypothetical protein